MSIIEVGSRYSTGLKAAHRMIVVVTAVTGEHKDDTVRFDAIHACDACYLKALYSRSLPMDGPNWLYVNEFAKMYEQMAPYGAIALGGFVPPKKVREELVRVKPRISYAEFQAKYLSFKSRSNA